MNTGQPLSFSPLSFIFILSLFDPFFYLISVPLFLRSLVPMVPYALLLFFAYCFTFGYARCLLRCPTLYSSASYSARLISIAMPDTITYPSRCLAQLSCCLHSYDSSWPLTRYDLALCCRVYKTVRSLCISSA